MPKSIKIAIKQLENAKGMSLPRYVTKGAAAVDLEAAIDSTITLKPSERVVIPTGIAFALPDGYEVQLRPRSGLAAKHGISIVNSPATIDSDYRGEIKVILINHGQEDFIIERGMRIAQMVITEYTQADWDLVDELDETERGAGGLGSTG